MRTTEEKQVFVLRAHVLAYVAAVLTSVILMLMRQLKPPFFNDWYPLHPIAKFIIFKENTISINACAVHLSSGDCL